MSVEVFAVGEGPLSWGPSREDSGGFTFPLDKDSYHTRNGSYLPDSLKVRDFLSLCLFSGLSVMHIPVGLNAYSVIKPFQSCLHFCGETFSQIGRKRLISPTMHREDLSNECLAVEQGSPLN